MPQTVTPFVDQARLINHSASMVVDPFEKACSDNLLHLAPVEHLLCAGPVLGMDVT